MSSLVIDPKFKHNLLNGSLPVLIMQPDEQICTNIFPHLESLRVDWIVQRGDHLLVGQYRGSHTPMHFHNTATTFTYCPKDNVLLSIPSANPSEALLIPLNRYKKWNLLTKSTSNFADRLSLKLIEGGSVLNSHHMQLYEYMQDNMPASFYISLTTKDNSFYWFRLSLLQWQLTSFNDIPTAVNDKILYSPHFSTGEFLSSFSFVLQSQSISSLISSEIDIWRQPNYSDATLPCNLELHAFYPVFDLHKSILYWQVKDANIPSTKYCRTTDIAIEELILCAI